MKHVNVPLVLETDSDGEKLFLWNWQKHRKSFSVSESIVRPHARITAAVWFGVYRSEEVFRVEFHLSDMILPFQHRRRKLST